MNDDTHDNTVEMQNEESGEESDAKHGDSEVDEKNNTKTKSVSADGLSKSFICPRCGKGFTTGKGLGGHLGQHTTADRKAIARLNGEEVSEKI